LKGDEEHLEDLEETVARETEITNKLTETKDEQQKELDEIATERDKVLEELQKYEDLYAANRKELHYMKDTSTDELT
jgi:hypothetical protein